MRKVYALLVGVFAFFISQAQVTGTKTIGVDYPTLAAAVSALNSSGVGSGGAVINVPAGYAETAPSGGFVIGSSVLNASLSSTNQLIIQKSGSGVNPLLTAYTGGTSLYSDGIVTLAGADYVTVDGIDVQENAANTGNAKMEWGYGLVNLNATGSLDGAQYNTIKNCKITLDKTNVNGTFGISTQHLVPLGSTFLTLTSSGDTHSNNKFYGNTISNVSYGVMLFGFSDSSPYALYDQGNDVGGSSAATGNTMTNLGLNSNWDCIGVQAAYQNNFNVSNNSIDNAAGGSPNTTGFTAGIFSYGVNTTCTISNNTINAALSSSSDYLSGVDVEQPSTGNSGVITISGNKIKLSSQLTTSASPAFVYCSSTVGTLNVTNNSFESGTIAASTDIYLVYANSSTPTINVTTNKTNGAINKTGSGGTFYGYYNLGSPTSGTATISNNDFSNVSVTGATGFYGIYQLTSTSQTGIINNNTISNITGGTSSCYGIYFSYGATGCQISNNTISNISTLGTLTGIVAGTSTASTSLTVAGNKITSIASTGASTVAGITAGVGTATTISGNLISGLTATNASGVVYGVSISGGKSLTLFNNLIGDLNAPITSSSSDAVRGISLTSTTSTSAINVYNNTVYLAATSTGTNFSSSALYHSTSTTSTTAALTLRNNILYNKSIAKGSGFATAFRRSSGGANTLNNYAPASNNNLFFAGTPSSSQLIYYDGTSSAQTLAAFTGGTFTAGTIAPRDAASVTELSTPFVTTSGSAATFLHLNPAVATVAESGGANIAAVTTDFDGDTRNATTPDIGADEFAGITVSACNGSPTAGVITGSANICQGQATVLTLSNFTSATGISIQWLSSSTSGGTFNPIAGAVGANYNTGVITAGTTVYYKATVTCANGGASATTAEFSVTSNANPTITISPAAPVLCAGNSTTLTASGASTYTWSPATGLSATTGNAVTATPGVTTTYTVNGLSTQGCPGSATVTVAVNPIPVAPVITPASATICAGTVQQLSVPASAPSTYSFGTQANKNTGSVSSTDYPAPYTLYYGGQRMQFLIRASELTAAGFSAGSTLNSIQFPVVSLGSNWPTTTTACKSFQVKVGTTALTTLSSFQSGLTQVVSPADFTPAVGYGNTHSFSSPVTWDGTSNLIIETTFSNNISGASNDLVVQYNSPTSYQACIVYRADNVTAAAAASATTVTYSYSARPDFKLNGVAVLPVTWSPITDLYTDAGATVPYVASANAPTVYAKPAVTTTYAAAYTNSYGCPASTNVTVTVGTPILTPTITQPTTCVSTDGAISLAVSGGAGPYTFAWTGPGVNAGAQNQTGLTAGIYSVTVTGSVTSCPVTQIFNLDGPGGCNICPTIGALASVPAGTVCTGPNNVTLTASGLTDMGVTYGIQFKASTTPLADPYSGGTVIATVANSALSAGKTVATGIASMTTPNNYYIYAILTPTPPVGCRPSQSVNLTVNSAPTVVCPANITVNATAGQCGAVVNYPAATITGVPAPTVSYSTPSGSTFPVGVTTVTVTATNSCSTATCSFTVTVKDVQPPTITCPANITTPSTAGACNKVVTYTMPTATDNCSGTTVTASPASGSTFPIGTTTVTVTAKDASNNTTTCSFTVTVTDAQLPVISAQPQNAKACTNTGATFSVTATNATGYQWQVNSGSGFSNINGATAATYTITNPPVSMNGWQYRVIVNGLCTNVTSNTVTLSVYTVPQVGPITASPSNVVSPGSFVSLSTGFVGMPGTFTWYLDNNQVQVSNAPVINGISVDDLGAYTVKLTDINGCQATSGALTVKADPNFQFFVYPTPNNGQFQVRFYAYTLGVKRTLRVYDSKGTMVFRKEFVVGSPYEKMDVDVSRYAHGIYHVELRDADGKILGTGMTMFQ